MVFATFELSKAIISGVCVAVSGVGLALAQASSGEPQTYMKKVGFTAAEVATMESGKPVTRIVQQQDDNDASVVGVIRIEAPVEALVDGIRRIEVFRKGGPTLQIGRFGATPDVSDLKPLVIDDSEIEDLRRCKVGDCEIRIGTAAMDLARKVDWDAPTGHARASQLIKESMVQLVKGYLEHGSTGMAVYNDHDVPESVSADWEKILRNSPDLIEYDPEFWRYLLAFPKATLPGVESFVYWSKDKIRKPVVSIVHACIQRVEKAGSTSYFIALKHIYDSHYYMANAEFLTLVPDRDAKTSFFLVHGLRARIDPPRKLRGMLLGKIKGAMRDELVELLQGTKDRLERGGGSAESECRHQEPGTGEACRHVEGSGGTRTLRAARNSSGVSGCSLGPSTRKRITPSLYRVRPSRTLGWIAPAGGPQPAGHDSGPRCTLASVSSRSARFRCVSRHLGATLVTN